MFVLYLSSASTSQSGDPFEHQRGLCASFVSQLGGEVAAEYRDVRSGLDLRPNMRRLLIDGKARKFDSVVVADAARISRDGRQLRKAVLELKRHDVLVWSMDSPGRPLHEHLAGAVRREADIKVVRDIFAKSSGGLSTTRIAQELSDEPLPPWLSGETILMRLGRAFAKRLRQSFISVVVSVEAVDSDGVLHTWRSPRAGG